MTDAKRILCLDDDEAVGAALVHTLGGAGYEVLSVKTAPEALKVLGAGTVDLVLCDYRMPHMTGMEFLSLVREGYPDVPFIMLTGYGSIELAVSAIKAGATDYITKPVRARELVLAVEQAFRVAALRRQSQELRAQVQVSQERGTLLWGKSSAMRRVQELAEVVARTKATVLLSGESGTGKEIVARYIHEHSDRSRGAFIQLNCAALPEGLIESSLFGHEKGAFTGAIKRVEGAFERAHGGTLLLDEVSEMRLDLQAKLLRVLQEQRFERVGGTSSVQVDVRVIATTNRILEEEVRAGRFRQDLYYRLHVMPILLPPLRERGEDILLLAYLFASKTAKSLGKPFEGFSSEATALLLRRKWDGNVRELEHAVERAVILSGNPTLDVGLFDGVVGERLARLERDGDIVVLPEGTAVLDDGRVVLGDLNIDKAETYLIQEAMRRADWNKTRAAEMLGLSSRTLRNKLARLQPGSVQMDDEELEAGELGTLGALGALNANEEEQKEKEKEEEIG